MSLLIFSFEIINEINDKIDANLVKQFENNKEVDCLIQFHQKANIHSVKFISNKTEKGFFVYNQLSKVSRESQKDVVAYLESEDVSFSNFIIVNAIAAKLTKNQVERISKFENVKAIAHDPWVRKEKNTSSRYLFLVNNY